MQILMQTKTGYFFGNVICLPGQDSHWTSPGLLDSHWPGLDRFGYVWTNLDSDFFAKIGTLQTQILQFCKMTTELYII